MFYLDLEAPTQALHYDDEGLHVHAGAERLVVRLTAAEMRRLAAEMSREASFADARSAIAEAAAREQIEAAAG